MNDNVTQPKNISRVVPLAREIPEYRQARMAGKKYVGPMININPFWHQTSSLSSYDKSRGTINIKGQKNFSSTPRESQGESIEKQVAVDEIGKMIFSEEETTLGNILAQKEAELQTLKQKTAAQKKQLETLTNASRVSHATVKNLKQQLGNIEERPETKQTMDDLKQQITQKEQESQDLAQQASVLANDVGAEQRLEEEITAYRTQVRELKQQQERLQTLVLREEKQLRSLVGRLKEQTQENESKEGKILELQKLLDETMNEAFTQPKAVENFVPAGGNAPNKVLPLSQEPNAINGIVKDSENKLIATAVVIVKDVAGHNLRALQSNQLGQFVLTTPLQNGTYYIEATKSGLSFPVVEVQLTGKPVAPVVLTADELTT